MASLIDPITGLPLDFRVPDQYQIPLDSQPVLAPEWNPQGRINQTLFPDNIPTVFATGQAQNELNPKNVQAMTTDGLGNLNVNVKAGGGGGSSTAPTISPYSGGWGEADNAPQGSASSLLTITDPTKPIWSVVYTINAQGLNGSGPNAGWIWLFFLGETSGAQLPIALVSLSYSFDGTTYGGIPAVSDRVDYNPGFILSTYFSGGENVDIACQPSGLKVNALCGYVQ